MLLDRNILNDAVHNSIWTEEDEEGFLFFRRFTPSQMEVYWDDVIFVDEADVQQECTSFFKTTEIRYHWYARKHLYWDLTDSS